MIRHHPATTHRRGLFGRRGGDEDLDLHPMVGEKSPPFVVGRSSRGKPYRLDRCCDDHTRQGRTPPDDPQIPPIHRRVPGQIHDQETLATLEVEVPRDHPRPVRHRYAEMVGRCGQVGEDGCDRRTGTPHPHEKRERRDPTGECQSPTMPPERGRCRSIGSPHGRITSSRSRRCRRRPRRHRSRRDSRGTRPTW